MKIVIPIDREEHDPALAIRGGFWSSNPSGLQALFRNYYSPAFRGSVIGFRLVRKK